jgi:hypothetical protein
MIARRVGRSFSVCSHVMHFALRERSHMGGPPMDFAHRQIGSVRDGSKTKQKTPGPFACRAIDRVSRWSRCSARERSESASTVLLRVRS